MAITAPRGTQDVVPSDSYKWQFVERTALEAAALFGFREIRTPTVEQMSFDTDYIVTSSTSYLGRYGYLRVAYTF